jgi:nicotinate phosphoribosyltransferase
LADALFTDYYELTMMAGYLANGRADEPATFDLFFRYAPAGVDIVVFAGLEPVLEYLEGLAFTGDDLEYLRGQGVFDTAFLDWLARMRFTGDVWAIPEGTAVFGNEPLIRVSAPLAQGQLIETALINRVAYSSLIASNALQVTNAARGKPVLEFGARRAHGPDGAVTASRAAMIGGCAATSNVEAGRRYGLPLSGTQAHSWIMAWEHEIDAFRAYAATFPENCVLLIDTYDTIDVGLPNAITVAKELDQQGHRLGGVRLDSGDLAVLSKQVRAGLDGAGFPDVRIIVSGDLDGPSVTALERVGAPIDGYGVGTALVTARRDPAFSGVYKLSTVDEKPVMKLSSTPEKATDPGRKQVWRTEGADVIGLDDESLPGEPLLRPVMREGRRLAAPESIETIAARCQESAARIRAAGGWEVSRTPRLRQLREELTARLRVDADQADPLTRT